MTDAVDTLVVVREAVPCRRTSARGDAVGREGVHGHVFVRVVDKPPSPQPGASAIGYVTNLYVVPERRGSRIGGRLLDAMSDWAPGPGLDALVVWPSDEGYSDLERVGFTNAHVLQLPLGGRGWSRRPRTRRARRSSRRCAPVSSRSTPR